MTPSPLCGGGDKKLESRPMRFTRFISNYVENNPGGAVWVAVVGVLLLLAALPLLVSLLPVRKVPLRYNLRNLQVRWKTTLVTALAFTLVTALMTVMLAFVTGMQ